MGIPLQSSPPHYYSQGVVRRMNFLGNYFGLYFFLHALKNRVEQHDVTPKTVKCFCVPTNNKAPVLPCLSRLIWINVASNHCCPRLTVTDTCTIWHCKIKLVWEWNGVNVGARAAGKSVEGFDVIKVFAFCRMSPSCRELLQIFCWSSCLSLWFAEKSTHKTQS